MRGAARHGAMAVGAPRLMRCRAQQCEAQKKVLQSCPEFSNNWCYQDLGGTQQLLSPCPGHLVCHYCLGMNPLYCA